MSIYKIEELKKDTLYCIIETESVNMYLVIGDKYALLIDTGYGYGKVMPIIESLTKKELLVIVTHGDPDHALGSSYFDKVMIHQADVDDLYAYDTLEFKEKTVDYRLNKMPQLAEFLDVENFFKQNLNEVSFEFVQGGDTIDLGGITFEIIEVPGHSKGSIALFERQKGWLFTGDVITEHNIWNLVSFPNHCQELSVLMNSYNKVEKIRELVSEVYPAHGRKPIKIANIDEWRACLIDLLENYKDDEQIQTFIGPAFLHKYKGREFLYSQELLDEALAKQKSSNGKYWSES